MARTKVKAKKEYKEEVIETIMKAEEEEKDEKGFKKVSTNKGRIKEYVKGVLTLGKKGNGERYIDPILMLIKEDGEVEVLEEMVAGVLTYKGGSSEKDDKQLELDPNKMLRIPSGDPDNPYRGWVAYEGEGTAYPQDVVYDARRIAGTFKRMHTNYRDFEEERMAWLQNEKLWMYIVGAIILMALVFGNLETVVNAIKSLIVPATEQGGENVITGIIGGL